jgi:hypothetical protein
VACEKKTSVEGLWLVEKVQIGEESMTPIARWMRFNSNSTQTSGNGWLQHSYGTWSLEENQLSVNDTNGIKDEAGSFTIELQENTMTWKRMEEGQEVVVQLKRIQELPQSDGNRLVGLWKLTKALNDGNDVTAVLNPAGNAMLHLRWDHMYVEHNTPEGREFGIYKIHAHKPEIQLVNYGNASQFSFWNFQLENQTLTFTSTDGNSVMEFERIYSFL